MVYVKAKIMKVTPTNTPHMIFEFLSGKFDFSIKGLIPKYVTANIARLISNENTRNVIK